MLDSANSLHHKPYITDYKSYIGYSCRDQGQPGYTTDPITLIDHDSGMCLRRCAGPNSGDEVQGVGNHLVERVHRLNPGHDLSMALNLSTAAHKATLTCTHLTLTGRTHLPHIGRYLGGEADRGSRRRG